MRCGFELLVSTRSGRMALPNLHFVVVGLIQRWNAQVVNFLWNLSARSAVSDLPIR